MVPGCVDRSSRGHRAEYSDDFPTIAFPSEPHSLHNHTITRTASQNGAAENLTALTNVGPHPGFPNPTRSPYCPFDRTFQIQSPMATAKSRYLK